jgi:hypothetical protein
VINSFDHSKTGKKQVLDYKIRKFSRAFLKKKKIEHAKNTLDRKSKNF